MLEGKFRLRLCCHFDCSPDGLVKRWGEEDLHTAVPVEEF